MKKQGVTFVVVRALARRLQSQADFLFNLVGEEERLIPQAQIHMPSALVANQQPSAETNMPPADWLARKEASGPSAHWLQRVQQDAPELLTHANRISLISKPTAISQHRVANAVNLSIPQKPVALAIHEIAVKDTQQSIPEYVARDIQKTTHEPVLSPIEESDGSEFNISLPNNINTMPDLQWPMREESVPLRVAGRSQWPAIKRMLAPALQFKKWGSGQRTSSERSEQQARPKSVLQADQQTWELLDPYAGVANKQVCQLAAVDEYPSLQPDIYKEHIHQSEYNETRPHTVRHMSEEISVQAVQTTQDAGQPPAYWLKHVQQSTPAVLDMPLSPHQPTARIQPIMQAHVNTHTPHVRRNLAEESRLRNNPERLSQPNMSASVVVEQWPHFSTQPSDLLEAPELVHPAQLDSLAKGRTSDTHFIQPINRASWPNINNAAYPNMSNVTPAAPLHVLHEQSEQYRVATHWPVLLTEQCTADQPWSRTRQAWQRQQRLDDEQRGNVWNV